MPQVLPLPEEDPLDEALLATALALALVMVLVEPSELTEMDVTVTITAEAAGRELGVSFSMRREKARSHSRLEEVVVVEVEEGTAAGGVVVVVVVGVVAGTMKSQGGQLRRSAMGNRCSAPGKGRPTGEGNAF